METDAIATVSSDVTASLIYWGKPARCSLGMDKSSLGSFSNVPLPVIWARRGTNVQYNIARGTLADYVEKASLEPTSEILPRYTHYHFSWGHEEP